MKLLFRCDPQLLPCCASHLLEVTMKKLALATALSLATTSAFAGGFEQPVPETPPIAVEGPTRTSSSGGIIVPLLLLLVVAAAVASN
jgi:hypothetical protein